MCLCVCACERGIESTSMCVGGMCLGEYERADRERKSLCRRKRGKREREYISQET